MQFFPICFLFFFLFFINCTLHNIKIDGKPAIRYEHQTKTEKKTLALERIFPDTTNASNSFTQLVQSYNSDSLEHLLKQDGGIEIDNTSNYILRYTTDITEELQFPLSVFLFLLTLGISPVVEIADASVNFQIKEYDSENVIKDYHYHVTQTYTTSWISIPVALFLQGDNCKLAMFHNHEFPEEMIVNQFQKDFYSDIHSQKLNLDTKTKNKNKLLKERFVILPVTFSHTKDKEMSEIIRDKVETLLVNKNFTVLERVKLKEIAKEFNLSQSGLTRLDQIELGKMFNASNLIITELLELNESDSKVEFSIKNIKIETGQIIWKYEFTIDESKTAESINRVIEELERKIK